MAELESHICDLRGLDWTELPCAMRMSALIRHLYQRILRAQCYGPRELYGPLEAHKRNLQRFADSLRNMYPNDYAPPPMLLDAKTEEPTVSCRSTEVQLSKTPPTCTSTPINPFTGTHAFSSVSGSSSIDSSTTSPQGCPVSPFVSMGPLGVSSSYLTVPTPSPGFSNDIAASQETKGSAPSVSSPYPSNLVNGSSSIKRDSVSSGSHFVTTAQEVPNPQCALSQAAVCSSATFSNPFLTPSATFSNPFLTPSATFSNPFLTQSAGRNWLESLLGKTR